MQNGRWSVPTRASTAVVLAVLACAGALLPAAAPAQAGSGELRPLVVIDAGHGGVDPGARGTGGTREKDVTLHVAKALAEELERAGGYEVRLTRTTDTLIALRDRTRFANRWRGEGGHGDRPAVFISIHANAHRDRGTRGFETYFLSDAKTADAERVAAMENAAQEFEEPQARPADDLAFILTDLRQNRYVHESSGWAEMIQRRLRAAHPGPNRGVKQAGFVVLDGAFMPAVLVELGFISNTREEKMLADRSVQREFAARLAAAVADYFERHEAISGALTP
jgi:N-acetylmuramoyl-L-alanine amidase